MDAVHDKDPAPSDRLVRLLSVASSAEAALIRGLLESSGIPALLKGELEGPYRMGSAEVWVPEGMEADARTIIAAARSAGDDEAPFE